MSFGKDDKHAVQRGRRQAEEIINERNNDMAGVSIQKSYLLDSPPDVPRHKRDALGPKRPNGTLIAEGDSWFDYPRSDILTILGDRFGFEIETVARRGDKVEEMAYSKGQLYGFTQRIEAVIRRGDAPRAVLLSGGGNDIAGPELAYILDHADSPTPGLNKAVLEGVINERLRHSYLTIITALTSVCEERVGRRLPILVHGYDYAVPDGRGFMGGWGPLPGPWLEPSFREKGYSPGQARRRLVRELIDSFNYMLENLTSSTTMSHVIYVNLRNSLNNDPSEYKKWWANELHPTPSGFLLVASRFAEAIKRGDNAT
ncbi:hypothetical protein [Halomonas korlensis]|uniref:GDSL-like Lipase/Acylhydrolase family n=1 Tax=Halomonas korlensis TaxID=463301 RepID=A0A1I7IYW7_9GAMM|nr:hypothetical protein [Halomonas korlensis]SFU78120.1 GDSL-like Lipase/Acylhydrolase family [Halomonas korlensis]